MAWGGRTGAEQQRGRDRLPAYPIRVLKPNDYRMISESTESLIANALASGDKCADE